MYKINGEVELILLNKDTLEEEDRIKAKNTITTRRMQYETVVGQVVGHCTAYCTSIYQELAGTSFYDSNTGSRIYLNSTVTRIVDTRISPNNVAINAVPFGSFGTGPSSVIYDWTYNYIGPGQIYLERKDRYQPPTGSNRTINTIFLSEGDSFWAQAYVSLANPCIQTTTQVLDVVYRWYFTYVPSNVSTIFSNLDTPIVQVRPNNLLRDEYLRVLWAADYRSFPYREQLFHSPYIPTFGQYENLAEIDEDIFYYNANNSAGWFRNNNTVSFSTSSNVGRLFGFYSVCGQGTGSNKRSIFAFKAVPNSFPNKPIHPVFNHNSAAPTPFLNVDFLASGQGKINISNNGWNQNNEAQAEMYRVDIAKTGDVGTSAYFIRKTKTVGYEGSTYQSRNVVIPWVDSNVTTFKRTYYGSGNNFNNIEEYSLDKYWVFGWVRNGINFFNMATGNSIVFDAIEFSTLNVGSIAQVACDEAGNLWVADRVTGLYKIETPLTTPVITRVINDPCYGVDVGFNDRIWVSTNNSLRYSDNYGNTWSTLSFTFDGITNNYWDRVKFIRTDKNDSQHIVLFVYERYSDVNTTTQRTYLAWVTGNGTATGITQPFEYLCQPTGTNIGFGLVGKVRCSRYGSFWCAFNVTDFTNSWGETYRIIPNDSSCYLFSGFGVVRTNFRNNICFVYDSFQNPYLVAPIGGNSNGPRTYVGIFSISTGRSCLGVLETINPRSGQTLTFTFEKNFDKCIYFHSGARLFACNPTITNESHGIRLDGVNGKNSILSEILYDTYSWNGSTWNKNVLTTLNNLGNIGGQIQRVRFDPGSHVFTGWSALRSLSFTNIGSSSLTFATNLRVLPKTEYISSQQHVVLRLESPTESCSFIIHHNALLNQTGNKFTLSTSTTNTKSSSSITSIINADNNIQRLVITSSPHTINKSYNLAIPNRNFWITNYNHVSGLTYTSGFKTRHNAIEFHYFVPEPPYNQDGDSWWGSSFGMTTISDLISEFVNHDFDVEFIRNESQTPWRNDNFTDGSFNLLVNFSLTPSTVTTGSYARVSLATSQRYLHIWFRKNHTAGNPRLYFSNGTTASNIDFTQVNAPTANDFNGVNKTIVQYRYNTSTQRWTINIVSENATTKALTTLWTVSPTQTFSSPTAGIVAFNYSDWPIASSSNSVIAVNGLFGATIQSPQITNFVNRSTSTTLTTTGTKFDIYVNGSLAGSLFNDYDVSQTNNVIFGNVSLNDNGGFRGDMNNIQLWNVSWNSTDVSNDASNPSGMITSKPASNCLIRLPLNETFEGTEIKPTHTTTDDLDTNTLRIRFTDGTISPSFVKDDYYTFAVFDGLLKDNATSFNQNYVVHTRPVKHGLEYIESATPPGAPTTIATIVAPQQTTVPIVWVNGNGLQANIPGKIGYTGDHTSASDNYGAFSIQSTTGNFVFSFKIGLTCNNTSNRAPLFHVGLTNSTSTAQGNPSAMNYRIYFGTDGLIQIWESSTQRSISPAVSFALDDEFSIVRIGTQITYRKNGVTFYTSTVASSGVLYPRVIGSRHCNLYDCKFTFTEPYPTLYLGSTSLQEGVFHPEFLWNDHSYIQVKIDNVQVPVTVDMTHTVSALPFTWIVPNSSSCVYYPRMGMLHFNSADIGKNVTVSYSTVYAK